jgi:VIT1/CCC1 family predicted Fe2+/Mn2+ transporter
MRNPHPMVPEPHHRDVKGGTARAAVFGISDGLVSNVAIVLGFAGANPAPGLVRLAGLAGLIGGAVSMAAGEYVSMTAQAELLERELAKEREELRHRPSFEREELAEIYRARGMDEETAQSAASQLMQDPEVALETHAREELGIHPGDLGRPASAAFWSLLTFSLGALVPLVPWFVTAGGAAVVAAVVLATLAALAVGAALARFTERPVLPSALRQLAFAAVPAAVTYAIGRAVGVTGLG